LHTARVLAWSVCAALCCATAVSAAESPSAPQALPAWVFPTGQLPPPAAGWDRATPLQLPGSALTFSAAQLHDRAHAVDWFPRTHPAMTPAVAHGLPPQVAACGYCHLPDGEGRPENASLAGLPADYILRQVEHFADGSRTSVVQGWGPSALMISSARGVEKSQAREAAEYFSTLPFKSRTRVIETRRVATPVAYNYLYIAGTTDRREPLGERLVEGPDSIERWEMRDPRVRYLAQVAPGSLRRGELLARGSAALPACASCHGPGLRGGSVGPPLAGRFPSYLLRQLYGFQSGARRNAEADAMRAVVAQMQVADMAALAAYAGSLAP
jgi:cytochrome c553